jgi:hypothetical protein
MLLRTSKKKIRVLRTITGRSLQNRKRSTEIREKCKVNDIVRWIRKEWNQHVTRMTVTEDQLTKIARKDKSHGGRPPKRWKDSWQSISQEQQQ